MTATADTGVAVGPLRTVALDGDGRGRRLRSAAVSDDGEVVFSAYQSGASERAELVLVSGGAERVIARARSFGGVDLADGGLCLYHADGVLYMSTKDTTARIGDGYESFAQPTLSTWLSEGGDRRYLAAFVARRPDGRKVAVLHPSHGQPVECLATGSTIGGHVVEDFRISRLGLALCCVATLRGDTGRYRKALIADPSHVISGDRVAEGGEIARLSSRSAVNVQMGFVKARLRDGGDALYSRPPLMVEPEVLVRTGDPLPGEPAARVARIGPPVTSSGIPHPGRFGVAAAVTVDNGRRGVWLGVFGGQHPLLGEAMTPLLDGDRTDDTRALGLRDFVPIKLTNRGALLAWAHSERGRVLVLAEGLFDWFGR